MKKSLFCVAVCIFFIVPFICSCDKGIRAASRTKKLTFGQVYGCPGITFENRYINNYSFILGQNYWLGLPELKTAETQYSNTVENSWSEVYPLFTCDAATGRLVLYTRIDRVNPRFGQVEGMPEIVIIGFTPRPYRDKLSCLGFNREFSRDYQTNWYPVFGIRGRHYNILGKSFVA
ncbi:MAG: hypothetical protein LBL16_02950 [Endomicrobium sp.]|jgi:hypothetical protein|nr:hypothetical protein [Endomicrobium sp.]